MSSSLEGFADLLDTKPNSEGASLQKNASDSAPKSVASLT